MCASTQLEAALALPDVQFELLIGIAKAMPERLLRSRILANLIVAQDPHTNRPLPPSLPGTPTPHLERTRRA